MLAISSVSTVKPSINCKLHKYGNRKQKPALRYIKRIDRQLCRNSSPKQMHYIVNRLVDGWKNLLIQVHY